MVVLPGNRELRNPAGYTEPQLIESKSEEREGRDSQQGAIHFRAKLPGRAEQEYKPGQRESKGEIETQQKADAVCGPSRCTGQGSARSSQPL